jgi:hypothetical protein
LAVVRINSSTKAIAFLDLLLSGDNITKITLFNRILPLKEILAFFVIIRLKWTR